MRKCAIENFDLTSQITISHLINLSSFSYFFKQMDSCSNSPANNNANYRWEDPLRPFFYHFNYRF